MPDRSEARTPFVWVGAVWVVLAVAVARAPASLLEELAEDGPLAADASRLAFWVLLAAAIAQAVYGSSLLRVERLENEVGVTPAQVGRTAALLVGLTSMYALAALVLTGARTTLWVFLLVALAQAAWYYRRVHLAAVWLGRQRGPRPVSGVGGWARQDPQRVALVSERGRVTFGELDERQRRVAGALTEAGLGEGDRVAVWSKNRPELLEVTVGTLRAGIVPVPVNALLTDGEAAYILRDSGARWLFTDRDVDMPLERIVRFGAGYKDLLTASEPADVGDHVRGRPMHYTSGTTGSPKGVWVEPYVDERAAAASADFVRYWDLRADDVHLVCSPFAHSAPHRYAIRTLEAGGSVVIQEGFDAEVTLAAIERERITTTFMVPTHLERIVALDDAARSYDLSSLRLLIHAGAPVREPTKLVVMDLLPEAEILEFYGSTEGHFTRITQAEWMSKRGSVGTPRPGATLAIVDDDGRPVAAGQVGEVWIDDPANDVFEYWGDEEKTSASRRGTAFTVGDLGYVDDDGYLFLSARKNDVIITGGVNVYPQEVEQILTRHPLVREAVVYGAPDEEWGQQVRAQVVPADLGLDVDELRAWARDHLAGYKLPKRIDLVDDLPRTPTGKVKRPRP